MARKPANVEWLGFITEQAELLDFLDHLGNNGWDRNGQTDEIMPRTLADCWEAGLTMPQVQQAMPSTQTDTIWPRIFSVNGCWGGIPQMPCSLTHSPIAVTRSMACA
jgi:hypothetical protein